MSRVMKFFNSLISKPSTHSVPAVPENVFGSNNIEISEIKMLFQVPNFRNICKDKSTTSAKAYIRHLPWTIMIKLNEAHDGKIESMSAFVICDYNVNSNWSCATEISLTLLSSNSRKNFTSAFRHCFERSNCCKSKDPFILWSVLIDPQNGYVLNDKIVIEVAMKCEEPKRVPWNSRKHTNFVGLEDKTENSFLNSFIQILYSIESFRVWMALLSSENEIQMQNVVRELQHIFRELNSSEVPVSIDAFAKLIGYRSRTAIEKCDSEYILNFLLKSIRKDRSTKQTSDVFHGQMSTLSTSTGKFEITELQPFNGLKLEICADADVDELLNKYFSSNSCINVDKSPSLIEVSTLYRWFYSLIRWTNPANSDYRTSVQFEKHIEIHQLPSILIMHLDRQPGSTIFKLQPKEVKFRKNISLSKFVKKNVDSSTKYVLHAVLVRRDTFSAFIHVNNEVGWLRFDNDIVSHCTEQDAIEETFRYVQMLVYSKCAKASGNDANDESAVQFNCIICMDATSSSDIFSTVCGHVFCGSCIKMEFSLRHKCPVCQTSLTAKDIHQIYI